jgi:hypothetical protein
VDAAIAVLKSLDLIGRADSYCGPRPLNGYANRQSGEFFFSETHSVLDRRIAFAGTQPGLLRELDDFLGSGSSVAQPDTLLHIQEESNGEFLLASAEEERFDGKQQLLEVLITRLNEFAAASERCLALHAGAVRSSAGEIVVLPAFSGSGKSTLTAEHVAQGWDYLGDETIGLRLSSRTAVGYPKRIMLDAAGRAFLDVPGKTGTGVPPAVLRSDVELLAGDVGPVSAVYLPSFSPGSATRIERLEPTDAVTDLLANTLNLARIGQPGLDALCDLAESVPVCRIDYGDARCAVRSIVRHLGARH